MADTFVIQGEVFEGPNWLDRDELKRELEENPDNFVDTVGELLKSN